MEVQSLTKKIELSSSVLLPADIDAILEEYGDILESYQNFRERNSIYATVKQTKSKLDILFPLKEHPIHGITGIPAVEKYDANGIVRKYHYQWKRIIPKEGIMFSHISAWENESHGDPNTPAKYLVKTEPHHHHYKPGDRKARKENYNTRTLEAVFEFVAIYIRSGNEYKP